jgi:hypothetical protein
MATPRSQAPRSTVDSPGCAGAHLPRRGFRSARLAVALVLVAQACATSQVTPSNVPVPTGRWVRVRSATPFPLGQPAGAQSAATVCHATALEGEVTRVTGDTIVIANTRSVISAPGPDGGGLRCPRSQALTLVRAPEIEIVAPQRSEGRTSFFLVGTLALLLALPVYAASRL